MMGLVSYKKRHEKKTLPHVRIQQRGGCLYKSGRGPSQDIESAECIILGF